jgi:hypothetical protein
MMSHPVLIAFVTSVATALLINTLGWRMIHKRRQDAALQSAKWRLKRSAD